VQGEAAKKGVDVGPKRGALWIAKNLGLRGLYRGASACLLRDVPFSAIYFPAYSNLKSGLFGESPEKKLGVFPLLISGAIAGMPAAYLTTPCDVIKTRLQVKVRHGEVAYRGVTHAVITIAREEGLRAFFKGGPARIMRSSPQFGFTLAAYELLQNILPMSGSKLDGGPGVAEVALSLGSSPETNPHVRSRNALKLILDVDESLGQLKLPDATSWKRLPSILGGGAGRQ